jgi:hypothetical protein
MVTGAKLLDLLGSPSILAVYPASPVRRPKPLLCVVGGPLRKGNKTQVPRGAQKPPFASIRNSAQCPSNDSEGHLKPFPNFLALPDRAMEVGHENHDTAAG